MRNKENEQLVMDFFNAMGPTLDDVLAAHEKYMHPQGIWRNSGFPDMVGIDAMKNLLIGQTAISDVA